MAMKIGAGAGHGGNDPGAVSQGNREADIVRMINNVMIEEGTKRGAVMVDATVNKGYPYNIDEPVMICNKNGVTIAVQNHANAGGGTGVEVLHWHMDSNAARMAARISSDIAAAYNLRNRGAKPRSDLGFINGTTMRAFIIEWGFVDAPGNTDIPKILADIKKGVNAALTAMDVAEVPKSSPARKVWMWDNNLTGAQMWDIITNADGTLSFKNRLTALFLDVVWGMSASGTEVCGYPSNGTLAQKWRIVEAGTDIDVPIDKLAGKVVNIKPMVNQALSLDVQGNNTAKGTRLQTWTSHNGDCQRFRIAQIIDGSYTIFNVSGKTVDVAGGLNGYPIETK